MKRYCEPYIIHDLNKKMVFIGGPRQVGKTTLSRSLCHEQFTTGEYFNWDVDEDRRAIQNKQWLDSSPLVIFDELHKYPHWKQWIKGIYDIKPAEQTYLVTGSARLDVYRRGGDSLMGRYHHWRLHPLTLDELPLGISKAEGFERLLNLGGFPEPFLNADEREARRWRSERYSRIIQEDIRDLESVKQLQLLSLLVDALRDRVSGLITFSNLAEDLHVSPKTIKSWINLIERMYICFAIYPMTNNISRSIIKPPKIYFYDNADCFNNNGKRLENLVATTLLKRLNFLEDYYGHRCQLHYIRDKEGREVDFVTVVDGKVIDLIEVKQKDTDISTALKYYAKKLKPERAVQLVSDLKRSFNKDGVLVTHPIDLFVNPPWEQNG